MSNIKQKSLPSQSEVQPIIDNFSNGNFNQAKIQAETLYLEYPNAVFLANILGICFLNLGDNANAEKHLKNAFSLSPNDFQTCSNLGLVLQKIGKFEEAIIYFKKAIKLNKDVPELFFNFALCLNNIKDYKNAVINYEKSIELQPKFGHAYYNLGLVYWKMNKLQNALECLNKANELISPVNPEIIASIGAVYKKTGDYENAEKYTLLAIKEKNDSRFIFNLATIYRDQGKINKAQELYEKVVESNPNFAEAYNNLGEVNRDLGNSDIALRLFEKALSIDKNLSQANYNIAILFQDEGKFLDAINFFEKSNFSDWKAKICYCLYKSNEEKKFEYSLNDVINQKNWSPLIASLSSHYSASYKKEDKYNFCAEPFKFIKKIPMQILLDDETELKDQIINDLKNTEIGKRKQGRLINGVQSAGNLLRRKENSFKLLAGHILIEIDNYLSLFSKDSCEYISSFPEKPIFQSSWYVKMSNQGYLTPHIHETGWMSGVLYLKLPKNCKSKEEGLIEFGIDGDEYPKKSPSYHKEIYEISEGDLLLFPSSVFHRTIPFSSDEERICIAFDIAPPK